MNMRKARELAAGAWCHPSTRNKIVDVDLVEEFARILEKNCNRLIWHLMFWYVWALIVTFYLLISLIPVVK